MNADSDNQSRAPASIGGRLHTAENIERARRVLRPGNAADAAQDALTADLMISESPEGAPPLKPDRERSSVPLILAGIVAVIGVIVLLVVGGIASAGMGLVLAAILAVAAFPVWVAALLRHKERRRAAAESKTILGWSPLSVPDDSSLSRRR